MQFGIKMWLVVVVFVLLFVSNLCNLAEGAPQVPCYFIFGDSLADNGNNNNLPTMAKANYPPYGIEFLAGPTGRFSNGRTTVDRIAELLGFDDFIPPFATARGNDVLKGVNYASGAAGIRSESGLNQGARISMDGQLKNHQITVWRIALILGDYDSAAKYLNKCIYSVGMGSNDYINNYYFPQFFQTSRQFTPEQYAVVLINQFSQQLKLALYDSGARKFALIGLGQIGCTPLEVAMFGTNGAPCVETINNAVQLFNGRLKSFVDDFNNNLSNAKFIYLDSFNITTGSGAGSFIGFKVFDAPCCEIGSGGTLCRPFGPVCPNKSENVFWDNVHPTEAVNLIVGERFYNAQFPSDAHPFDINHLAQL